MRTLDEIAIGFQTDKASQFSRTYAMPHDYCRHLEIFFDAIRMDEVKVLEIGVGGGESVQTWLEYFPVGRVYGVDVIKNTNPWNDTLSAAPANERYKFLDGNQGDPEFWQAFISECGTDFDVIIDDGSHISSDIMTTFTCLWPHVKLGGLYEIEDLNAAPEVVSWLMAFVGNINAGAGDVDAIHFSKELAIIRKRE